jgi:hypothetical protein
MPKIVINSCYGGFGLSHAAIVRYGEIKGLNLTVVPTGKESFDMYRYYKDGIQDAEHSLYYYDISRDDPALVQTVEELGDAADDNYAQLRIADVPDDVEWYIDEYDGIETVREQHRTW